MFHDVTKAGFTTKVATCRPPQLTFLHANWTFAAGFDLIEHTGRCGCGHDVRIKRRHGQVAPLRSHQSTRAVSSLVAFFVVFVHTHPPTHTQGCDCTSEFFLSVGRVFIRFIRFRKYTQSCGTKAQHKATVQEGKGQRKELQNHREKTDDTLSD